MTSLIGVIGRTLTNKMHILSGTTEQSDMTGWDNIYLSRLERFSNMQPGAVDIQQRTTQYGNRRHYTDTEIVDGCLTSTFSFG